MPYAVHYVEITYDRDGRMTRASLALNAGFSRESLVYEPGYSIDELRAGEMPSEWRYEPVDADWYHYWEDRM